jgi:hypothetical protein
MNTENKRYVIQCTGTSLIDGLYSQESYGSGEGLEKLQDIAAYWASVTGYPTHIHLVTRAEVFGYSWLNDYYGPTAKYRRSAS